MRDQGRDGGDGPGQSREAAVVEMERRGGCQESAWAETAQLGGQVKQEAAQPHSEASTRALRSLAPSPVTY